MEHYLVLPIFSYFPYLFFRLTPIESKTNTKATAILKALMNEEVFEVYLEDKGIT